jgi:ribosomal protein L16 Arg81 hydroxylase
VTADSSDSFVIQLKDEAKWSLYAPQPGMELMMESTVEIASESLPDKPTQERVLKAGDSLYIPKGWGYASKCVSDNDDFSGQSLHLRVFTNHKNSIIDLLDRVVPNAVTVIASEHVSVRE